MSLAQLRSMRLGGQRPASVTVIVGRPPKSLEDGPDVVVVNRSDADLSPLVGLPVHVIDMGDAKAVLRVIAQLEALKVVPLGICGPAGACGVSREHEQAMRTYRETLCLTR
jgi:hypothetical protein